MIEYSSLLSIVIFFIGSLALYTWVMCAFITGAALLRITKDKPTGLKLVLVWVIVYLVWPALLINTIFDMVSTKLSK